MSRVFTTAKLLLAVSAGALTAEAAHAQASQTIRTKAERQKVELDDIVVTADRKGFGADLVQVGTFRNAKVIDVPLTVNVGATAMRLR